MAIVSCGSPENRVTVPPDVQKAIERTLDAHTARFSTTTTVSMPGTTGRVFSEANGIIDFQSATGDLTGILTPDPFPSPGIDPATVAIETIDVNGTSAQRAGGGQWRSVDGGLGSFLQLGTAEASFRDAMREVLQPVAAWAAVDAATIRGVATQHFAGAAAGAARGAVEMWLDADGNLRRVQIERGSDQTQTTATIVLEFWDFGVPVTETLPPS